MHSRTHLGVLIALCLSLSLSSLSAVAQETSMTVSDAAQDLEAALDAAAASGRSAATEESRDLARRLEPHAERIQVALRRLSRLDASTDADREAVDLLVRDVVAELERMRTTVDLMRTPLPVEYVELEAKVETLFRALDVAVAQRDSR